LAGDCGRFPQYGRMGYVHIDDVAHRHVLVYEDDTSEGRYLCSSSVLDATELAAILRKLYPRLHIPRLIP